MCTKQNIYFSFKLEFETEKNVNNTYFIKPSPSPYIYRHLQSSPAGLPSPACSPYPHE